MNSTHASPDTRKRRAPSRDNHQPTGSLNKREIVGLLLTREAGATTAEILAATGWPAVSVPAQATANKLTLRTVKEGRATRYFGTPETVAEAVKAAKAEVARGKAPRSRKAAPKRKERGTMRPGRRTH